MQEVLGIVGAGNAPANVIKQEIQKVKSLTDKPFGINIYMISPYVDEVIKTVIEEKVPSCYHRCWQPGNIFLLLSQRI